MTKTKAIEGEIIPNPVGRPPAYDPSMCNTIIELGQQGKGIITMCVAIGVRSKTTWYNWKRKYPEFNDAAELALMLSAAWTEEQLQKHSTGQIKGDGKVLQWQLYNKNKDFYDMPYKQVNGDTTNISIGNINIAELQKLDDAQLDQRLEQIQKKLAKQSLQEED